MQGFISISNIEPTTQTQNMNIGCKRLGLLCRIKKSLKLALASSSRLFCPPPRPSLFRSIFKIPDLRGGLLFGLLFLSFLFSFIQMVQADGPGGGPPPDQQQQQPPQQAPDPQQQQPPAQQGPDPQQQQGGPPPGQDPNAQGGGGPPGSGAAGAPAPDNKSIRSDEDDFSQNAFTSYGEVNDSKEEQEDMLFYQYGRLFGVSLGLGGEFVTGNRGALWQGGVPLVDFKLHCWFDFNVALDIGLYTAQHYYNTTAQSLGYTNVNMIHIGVDLKYYVDVKNMSAPISFANPYLLIGAGSFSKTENSVTANYQNTDNSIGISLGGGLEFVITHRKIYFELEGKIHFVTFQDTYTNEFQSVGLTDLSGQFVTLSGSFLFTW